MMAWLLIFSLHAHANPNVRAVDASQAGSLHAMLNSRSVAELDRNERVSSKYARAKSDCEAELKERLLPRGCFRELRLQAQEHVYTAKGDFSLSKTSDPQTYARLAKICVTNAKASRSRLDLSRSLRGLPDECQRAASERLDDLHYIDEAEKPELSVMRTLGPDIETDTGQLD